LGNITEKQDAFFKKNQDVINSIRSDTDKIVDRVEEIESRAGSPGKTAPAGTSADRVERWIDRKSGELVPVLAHKDALSALQPNDTGISVGRWLRGVLTGKHADDQTTLARELKQLATAPDASGGYTVPEPLAREFIDALRARMVLSRAGARTVPMTSKTLAMARIDSDASVGWHAENASITPSEPTFGAATLSAKTIVSVCKLSLELSQDSINVEQAITRSLAGAMAVEIDGAGLGNTVANGPSGILSFSGRNQLPGIGALGDYDKFIDGMGALLGANVALEPSARWCSARRHGATSPS
jgi:HK97 family phage major capsid protein